MATDNKIRPGRKVKLGKYTQRETYLARQCKAYGVSPPTWQPIGNKCIVWRFPPLEFSPSGLLIIPEDAQSPHAKGLLVAAGPQAQDYLGSHGIKLGDEVVFARFAGDEGHDSTRTKQLPERWLTLHDKDILGCVELRTDLERGRMRYVTEGGKTKLERPKALPAMTEKKAKVLKLAEAGGTAAEKETAKRIAARMK